MDTEDKLDIERRLLPQQQHHELIQEYRKALHLHGDPSQSEDVSDEIMRKSISQAESALALNESH